MGNTCRCQKKGNKDFQRLLNLASFTDTELHRIIDTHRQELEVSIEEFVEDASRMISDASVFSAAENEKGAREERKIWKIFLQLQSDTPKLKNTLRKIGCDVNEEGGRRNRKGITEGIHQLNSRNEDFQGLLNFASFTDTQLNKIIVIYRQELQLSIEEFVEDVSRMICDANVFSEEENENISSLAGRNEIKEACQRILNILVEKGAREERQIWKIFLQLQSYTPKLKETLRKICYEAEEREDEEIIHRNTLRKRNMMMIVNISGTDDFRRYLLDEKYTNITIVCSLRAQKRMEDKLRARGAKREELQEENLDKDPGEVIELSQLIRSRFDKSENSNITVVYGAAGIGKSTMLQKIIYDWSIGKIYQEFKFVFPFNLRVFNSIDDEICLNSLILYSFPYLENQLEHLWSEPRSILFIFDDFDEIQPAIDFADVKKDTDSQTQPIHPGCYCKISDLVHCLLKGQLLNGCSVLITSRPWKRKTLANVQINLTAEIQGFSSQETTHFFLQHFGEHHNATELLKYIEHNETLHSLCSNPLYCTVLCSFVEKQLLKRDAMPPSIHSAEVFSSYITSLLERSHCALENSCGELLKIEELAYEGIHNNTHVFTEEKIKQHNLQCSRLSPVFMIEIPGKDPHSFVYSFSHFILQDFMAALMTIQNEPGKKPIRQFQDWQTCSDDRFQVVSRCLVALSSRNPFHRVESSMNKLSVETHSLMSDWLKENCKKLPDKLDDRRSQLMLLTMLHYILEFGDRNTTISALSQLKVMQFTKCQLQPSDYAAISRSLMDIDTIAELNLTTCDVEIEAINQLKNVLHKIIILRLNETKIGDSGVKLLSGVLTKEACKIRTLELKSNKLTDGCVRDLVNALNKNCSLKTLDLSNDSQNGEQANSLTDKSIPELKRISPNNGVFKEIRLMYNQFSAEGQCELKSVHLPDGLVFVTE